MQDARFDNHLTGVKKESFYWLTKTIAHNKGFPRKWKQIRHVEKHTVITKRVSAFISLDESNLLQRFMPRWDHDAYFSEWFA